MIRKEILKRIVYASIWVIVTIVVICVGVLVTIPKSTSSSASLSSLLSFGCGYGFVSPYCNTEQEEDNTKKEGISSENSNNNNYNSTVKTTTNHDDDRLSLFKHLSNNQKSKIHEESKTSRIYGGIESAPYMYSFMASLADKGQHHCGATLVAPDIFLTAAHCVGSFGEIRVGSNNIGNYHDEDVDDDNSLPEYESFVVDKIIKHPRHYLQRDYIPNDVDPFDFALVKVYGSGPKKSTPVLLNRDDAIPASTTSTATTNNNEDENHDPLVILGWGSTRKSIMNSALLEAKVDYIQTDECAEILQKQAQIEMNKQQHVSNNEHQDGGGISHMDRTGPEFKEQILRFSHDVELGITMCAADFTYLIDACTGDSGGPLLFVVDNENNTNSTQVAQFIQVGVIYSGFGCAHETLPGLYARTSYVHQWLDETICELSNHQLSENEFSCKRNDISNDILTSSSSQVQSEQRSHTDVHDDTDENDTVQLTIQIEIDDFPEERGWVLEQKRRQTTTTSTPKTIILAERPILSYASASKYSIITETINVPKNTQFEYKFTVLDSYGDGFCCNFLDRTYGYVSLFDESSDIIYISPWDSLDFSDYSQSWTFVIGDNTTTSTTTSKKTVTSSSAMQYGSASEFSTTATLTVIIHLDQYPTETGFIIELIPTPGRASLSSQMQQQQQQHLQRRTKRIKEVNPGTYLDHLANTTVYEVIELPIPGPEDIGEQFFYRFTITDNEGDGLFDPGFYQVWLGNKNVTELKALELDRAYGNKNIDDEDLGTLLFEGREFFLQETHEFQLPFSGDSASFSSSLLFGIRNSNILILSLAAQVVLLVLVL